MSFDTRQYLEEYERCLEGQKEAYLRDLMGGLECAPSRDQFKAYIAEMKLTPHLNKRQELCAMINSMNATLWRTSQNYTTESIDTISKFIAEYFLRCLFDHYSLQDMAIGGLSLICQRRPTSSSTHMHNSYYTILTATNDNDMVANFTTKLRFNTLSFEIKVYLCHILTTLLEGCCYGDIGYIRESGDESKKLFLTSLPLVWSNICEEETHPCILWFILSQIERYSVIMDGVFGIDYLPTTNHDLTKLYQNLNSYFPLSSYVLPVNNSYYVGYGQLSVKLTQVLVLYPSVNIGGCIDLVIESVNSVHAAQRYCCLQLLVAILDSSSIYTSNALKHRKDAATPTLVKCGIDKLAPPLLFHELIKPFVTSSSTTFQLTSLVNVNSYSKQEVALRCYLVERVFNEFYIKNDVDWIPTAANGQLEFYNSLIGCMFNYNNWHTARLVDTLLRVIYVHMPEEFVQYVYTQMGFFMGECEEKCRRMRISSDNFNFNVTADESTPTNSSSIGETFSRKFLAQLCTFLKVLKNEHDYPLLNNSNFITNAINTAATVIDYCISKQTETDCSYSEDINKIIRLIVFFKVTFQLDNNRVMFDMVKHIHLKTYILRYYFNLSAGDLMPPFTMATYRLLMKEQSSKPLLSFSPQTYIVDVSGKLSAYDIHRVRLMTGVDIITLLVNTLKRVDVLNRLSCLSAIFNEIYLRCNQTSRAFIDQFVYGHILSLSLSSFASSSVISSSCCCNERDSFQVDPILSKYIICMPIIFSRCWFKIHKTISIDLKYVLFQQLLLLAYNFQPTTPAHIIHQFIFSLLIYDSTCAIRSGVLLLMRRCGSLVEKCLQSNANEFKPIYGYLLCAKLYHCSFLVDGDVLIDINLDDDAIFPNLQCVLTLSKWIHWLTPTLANNNNNNTSLCRLFIQWLSLSLITSLEKKKSHCDDDNNNNNLSLVAPIVLRCFSNLPDYSKINPHILEKYISDHEHSISGSLLMDNIEIFTNISNSSPTIIISSQESITKAINIKFNVCSLGENDGGAYYPLQFKIQLINFFVVVLNIFASNKLTPRSPQFIKVIDFTLCSLIKDSKRVVRRAAAMCKNLLDTLPPTTASR